MQIPWFASLINDDDYDSDNKEFMPLQDTDNSYIQTINSDSCVDNIPYKNEDDDRDNEKNKWIFMRMYQKSQLVQKMILFLDNIMCRIMRMR